MSVTPADDAPEALPEGRMEGREAFTGLIRAALSHAAQQGWSPLVLSDIDFADWPLGERAVLESLNAWASSGRQLHFLAKDFNVLRQRHPRLVQWRTTWSHLVEARVCSGAAGEGLPSALWTPHWTLERLDGGQHPGTAPARFARAHRCLLAQGRAGISGERVRFVNFCI